MKKILGIGLSLILIVLAVVVVNKNQTNSNDYFRIHIKANSNSVLDQDIKVKVRDSIVEYISPIVATCSTKEQSVLALSNITEQMQQVAQNELIKNGFTYGATVSIDYKYFPTRVYEDFTLSSGYYDCIMVNLGSAQGDNWWCVVYPPLCFVGSAPVRYRSKIIEIIKSFRGS